MDVKETRHVCFLCGRKRVETNMFNSKSHWFCAPSCETNASTGKFKVLNLYSGIGGNRKLWPSTWSVTAVELNPKIAAVYQKLYVQDQVIVTDAHKYLIRYYNDYDLIWSSPPCVTHSRMNYVIDKKRYPDMSLYQEIVFLKQFYRGRYVIENVKPYYECLIKPDFSIDRHHFWSNITTPTGIELIKPEKFIECCTDQDRLALMDWLGIHFDERIYLSGKNHCQILKNAIHPLIGQHIINYL